MEININKVFDIQEVLVAAIIKDEDLYVSVCVGLITPSSASIVINTLANIIPLQRYFRPIYNIKYVY